MGEKGGIAYLNLPNTPSAFHVLRDFTGLIEFGGSGGFSDFIETQAAQVFSIFSSLDFILLDLDADTLHCVFFIERFKRILKSPVRFKLPDQSSAFLRKQRYRSDGVVEFCDFPARFNRTDVRYIHNRLLLKP